MKNEYSSMNYCENDISDFLPGHLSDLVLPTILRTSGQY
jgi:hypothetical protein